jgi:hypothetical protein
MSMLSSEIRRFEKLGEGAESSYGERDRVGQVLRTFCEQTALYHAVRMECGFPTMCDKGASLTEPDTSTNPDPT